jgi:hypothetical protein
MARGSAAPAVLNSFIRDRARAVVNLPMVSEAWCPE